MTTFKVIRKEDKRDMNMRGTKKECEKYIKEIASDPFHYFVAEDKD